MTSPPQAVISSDTNGCSGRLGAGSDGTAAASTRCTSIDCPPPVCVQWTAIRLLPAVSSFAAAASRRCTRYSVMKPVKLAALVPLMNTSASSSWWISRAGSAGTESSSTVRRSQISGVYQVVLIRVPGVEGSPKPPKPVFQPESSKPGFSQPSAGAFVVYCQAGSAKSPWAVEPAAEAHSMASDRQSRWRTFTEGTSWAGGKGRPAPQPAVSAISTSRTHASVQAEANSSRSARQSADNECDVGV